MLGIICYERTKDDIKVIRVCIMPSHVIKKFTKIAINF